MADKIQLKNEIFPKKYIFIELLEQIENCLCGEDVFIQIEDFINKIAISSVFSELDRTHKDQISKACSNIKKNFQLASEIEKIKNLVPETVFDDITGKAKFVSLIEQVIQFNKIKELFTKIKIDTDLSQLFSEIQNISKNSEISNILSKYKLTKDITFAQKLELISSLPEDSIKDVLAKSKQAAIFANIVDAYLSTYGIDEMVWENAVLPSSSSPSLGQSSVVPPPPPPPPQKPSGVPPPPPPPPKKQLGASQPGKLPEVQPPKTELHNDKAKVCNTIKNLLGFNKKTIGQENNVLSNNIRKLLEELNRFTWLLERKELESSNVVSLEKKIKFKERITAPESNAKTIIPIDKLVIILIGAIENNSITLDQAKHFYEQYKKFITQKQQLYLHEEDINAVLKEAIPNYSSLLENSAAKELDQLLKNLEVKLENSKIGMAIATCISKDVKESFDKEQLLLRDSISFLSNKIPEIKLLSKKQSSTIKADDSINKQRVDYNKRQLGTLSTLKRTSVKTQSKPEEPLQEITAEKKAESFKKEKEKFFRSNISAVGVGQDPSKIPVLCKRITSLKDHGGFFKNIFNKKQYEQFILKMVDYLQKHDDLSKKDNVKKLIQSIPNLVDANFCNLFEDTLFDVLYSNSQLINLTTIEPILEEILGEESLFNFTINEAGKIVSYEINQVPEEQSAYYNIDQLILYSGKNKKFCDNLPKFLTENNYYVADIFSTSEIEKIIDLLKENTCFPVDQLQHFNDIRTINYDSKEINNFILEAIIKFVNENSPKDGVETIIKKNQNYKEIYPVCKLEALLEIKKEEDKEKRLFISDKDPYNILPLPNKLHSARTDYVTQNKPKPPEALKPQAIEKLEPTKTADLITKSTIDSSIQTDAISKAQNETQTAATAKQQTEELSIQTETIPEPPMEEPINIDLDRKLRDLRKKYLAKEANLTRKLIETEIRLKEQVQLAETFFPSFEKLTEEINNLRTAKQSVVEGRDAQIKEQQQLIEKITKEKEQIEQQLKKLQETKEQLISLIKTQEKESQKTITNDAASNTEHPTNSKRPKIHVPGKKAVMFSLKDAVNLLDKERESLPQITSTTNNPNFKKTFREFYVNQQKIIEKNKSVDNLQDSKHDPQLSPIFDLDHQLNLMAVYHNLSIASTNETTLKFKANVDTQETPIDLINVSYTTMQESNNKRLVKNIIKINALQEVSTEGELDDQSCLVMLLSAKELVKHSKKFIIDNCETAPATAIKLSLFGIVLGLIPLINEETSRAIDNYLPSQEPMQSLKNCYNIISKATLNDVAKREKIIDTINNLSLPDSTLDIN